MATRRKKDAPIRLGLVGVGRAGWGMHVAALKSLPDKFQLVAACDPLKERRKLVEDEYGCPTYESIDELLVDPNVELVDIASPTEFHVDQATQALKAGHYVFLEKPIARSVREASKLTRAQKAAPRRLFIRHNRRFESAFTHIREIIDSGILGDVYEIKLRRHNFQRRGDWQTLKQQGGGQLLNWGPHLVDHALRFVDAKVDDVWSDLRKIAALGDAEDHVHIIIKGSGRVVDLEISGGTMLQEPVYTVFGTRGALTSDEKTIQLRYLDPKQKLKAKKADPGTPPIDAGFGAAEKLRIIEKEIPVSSDVAPNAIWDHLHASIRNKKTFPIRYEEALHVMRIISQARRGTQFDIR